jgi:hypothetical protein
MLLLFKRGKEEVRKDLAAGGCRERGGGEVGIFLFNI